MTCFFSWREEDSQKSCFPFFRRIITCFLRCRQTNTENSVYKVDTDDPELILKSSTNRSTSKMAPPPSKIAKVEAEIEAKAEVPAAIEPKIQSKIIKMGASAKNAKIWNYEGRLFCEKFFYLNKSTTKYVSFGLEPEYFVPVMRICDRITGNFITMQTADFFDFAGFLRGILDGTNKLNNIPIEHAAEFCHVSFRMTYPDVWILMGTRDQSSIALHKSSMVSFVRILPLINESLQGFADGGTCLEILDEIRTATAGMNEEGIFGYLYEQVVAASPADIKYQLMYDLIRNRDSLMAFESYNKDFYKRIV